jgi:hypothetical protein
LRDKATKYLIIIHFSNKSWARSEALQPFESRTRLKDMSETWKKPNPSDNAVVLPQTEARQGKTGLGVRYVLVISLIAAIVVLGLVYIFVGF